MTEEKKEKRELTLEEKYLIVTNNQKVLVKATEALQEKHDKLVARVKFLEDALENAQKQVEIQKQITRDSLAKHNEDNQKYADELQDLKFGKGGKKPKPVSLPIGR